MYTPARIPKESYELVLKYSEQIYHFLNCGGIVRVDFIITPDGVPYFIEINTIPGQTAMSIIPAQLTASGFNLKDFYTSVVMDALKN